MRGEEIESVNFLIQDKKRGVPLEIVEFLEKQKQNTKKNEMASLNFWKV